MKPDSMEFTPEEVEQMYLDAIDEIYRKLRWLMSLQHRPEVNQIPASRQAKIVVQLESLAMLTSGMADDLKIDRAD
jgi:hypothetical protein